MQKAIVLCSGGLDSTVCLAEARRLGFEITALTFRYGQRHAREVESAQNAARAMGAVDHRIVDLDLAALCHSSLTGHGDVPKDQVGSPEAIPSTYVPARNIIFLSLAAGLAESIGARDVFIGVNAIDYSGYPDCRPEFILAFEQMISVGTKAGVEGSPLHIHTPLIALSKADIVRRGDALGVDFSLTHSCYDPLPDGRSCGRCDSCHLRRKGFAEAGVDDPIQYAE